VSNGVICDLDAVSKIYTMGEIHGPALRGVSLQVQQRVAMVRALAKPPRTSGSAVVLVDGPTGNLDTHADEDIMKILISLIKREDRKPAMVAHDSDAGEKVDKVYNMRDGQIVNIS
jgi:ABC-type lipoprotein export system ATPase subunit